MRTFSILVLFLATLSFCLAASPASSAIHGNSLDRRQEEHGSTGHNSGGDGAAHSNEAAASPSPSSSSSEDKKNAGTATTGTETKKNNNSQKTLFAGGEILKTGTLFYIGIAVTFVLWCTGFALDFLSDRQEQLAYKLALSKKLCHLSPEYPAVIKA